MALNLQWGQCKAYLVDEWCRLLEVDTGRMDLATLDGVFVIWHGGSPFETLRVGQGRVKNFLREAKEDEALLKYAEYGLYATWARVPADQREGVVRYLYDQLNPKLITEAPAAPPIEVNIPNLTTAKT